LHGLEVHTVRSLAVYAIDNDGHRDDNDGNEDDTYDGGRGMGERR
jgi:hypothetical protein